jgi:hypothetical protein
MPVTVDADESVPGLPVVRERLLDVSRRPERGREVQLRRAEEIVGRAEFLAAVVRFECQLYRAAQVIHGTAVIDQVGGSGERAHVVVAQIVTVSLQDVFPLLQRVPVVPRLPQRGRELFGGGEPLGVLRPASLLERVRDTARYV